MIYIRWYCASSPAGLFDVRLCMSVCVRTRLCVFVCLPVALHNILCVKCSVICGMPVYALLWCVLQRRMAYLFWKRRLWTPPTWRQPSRPFWQVTTPSHPTEQLPPWHFLHMTHISQPWPVGTDWQTSRWFYDLISELYEPEYRKSVPVAGQWSQQPQQIDTIFVM